MVEKRPEKNKHKKNKHQYIEFKSNRNKWTKAELIGLKGMNKAIIKLIDGQIIRRSTVKKFRWGITKKVRKQ